MRDIDYLTLREIIIYCKRGWPVHPLKGKVPILRNWQGNATTDRNVVQGWLRKWPQANFGILTGAISNLLVLDVDGLRGLQSLKGLEMPSSPSVVTARGHHYYFTHPASLNHISTTRAGLLPGLDTRGHGGYIVAPPSIHTTGNKYYWCNPSPDPLPDAPNWLIHKLTPSVSSSTTTRNFAIGKNTHYTSIALRNEIAAVAQAKSGTRNNRLNQAAFSLGTLVAAGLLDISNVAELLAQAGLHAGLSRNEVEKTLLSGLSAGLLQSRST